MKTLLFRYSDTELDSLTVPTGAWTAEYFTADPVYISEPTPYVSRETGRLLNGRGYAHTLYSYKTLTVTLSSDDLFAAAITYLKNYVKAPFKYISFISIINGSYVYSDFVEVILTDADFGMEYTDGLKDFPEITFNFEYAGAE